MIQWLEKCKKCIVYYENYVYCLSASHSCPKSCEVTKQDVQFVRHDLYHFNVSMRRHNGPWSYFYLGHYKEF